MSRKYNENGYALLIVLFAIVFITVVTAVFMRGALSNAMQGQTLDKNNLVVVSAEAGVDYYTWNLKQLYDEGLLEAKFTRLVNEAIASKKTVDYDAIQHKIVSDFEKDLISHTDKLKAKGESKLFNEYTHKLTTATVKMDKKERTTYLIVDGTVEGKLPEAGKVKTKDLQFELRFTFPRVFTADGSSPSDPDDPKDETGSLIIMPILKSPKTPLDPDIPIAISRPATECRSSGNLIENQQCRTSSISEANYKINKSGVYIDNTLKSWGNVQLENSSMNIRGDFTPASILMGDTQMVAGGEITAYQSININKSKIQANELNNSGGTATISNTHMNISNKLEFQKSNVENSIIHTQSYKANDQANFNKTDLKVKTTYNSGGASFTNSILEIGTKLDTGGGLFYAEGSDVLIHGDAHTANGSTIKNSVMKIGGYFLHTSKPLDAQNSDIYVGGKVTATNGTNFEHVNMIVKGGYESSTKFKLDNTKLIINNTLSLSNGGELENSLLTAGKITSSTPLQLKGSLMASDYLNSDILRLDNSKVCTKELNVRDLGMNINSKIYYQDKTNKTGSNIIKLAPEEFEKKCGIQTGSTPEEPGKIDWKAPVVDKVIY